MAKDEKVWIGVTETPGGLLLHFLAVRNQLRNATRYVYCNNSGRPGERRFYFSIKKPGFSPFILIEDNGTGLADNDW